MSHLENNSKYNIWNVSIAIKQFVCHVFIPEQLRIACHKYRIHFHLGAIKKLNKDFSIFFYFSWSTIQCSFNNINNISLACNMTGCPCRLTLNIEYCRISKDLSICIRYGLFFGLVQFGFSALSIALQQCSTTSWFFSLSIFRFIYFMLKLMLLQPSDVFDNNMCVGNEYNR